MSKKFLVMESNMWTPPQVVKKCKTMKKARKLVYKLTKGSVFDFYTDIYIQVIK